MQPQRAVIFGCAGTQLTNEERRFFADVQPFGFILFARNVETPEQVKTLTASLRETVGWNAPILIDQEGGRVRRLRPPTWRDAPAMQPFGEWFLRDPQTAKDALRLNIHLLADELRELGITVDCAPVLDVPVPGAHDIIGDRAFSTDPEVVSALGQVVCEAFLERGVYPVIKHIPGHGRSMADSHHHLPVVTETLDELEKTDFVPFRRLAHAPFAMTAHIVYQAVDHQQPATLSPTVVQEVIRQRLGFDGLLMTDDLSMKALTGTFEERAAASIKAGCDLVLHCNGQMGEMQAVVAGTPLLDEQALCRWEKAQQQLTAAPLPLPETAESDFARYMEVWASLTAE